MDEQPINTQKRHWPFSTLDKNPCFSFWPQESLYYQPKQCTINGKSLKITLHLHQVWSSQNLVNSMIPRTPSPNFWKGLLGTCYPNRPNHLKIWSFYIQPSSPPPQKKTSPSHLPLPPFPTLPHVKTSRSLPRLWQIGQRANDLLDLETVVHMPQQRLQHLPTRQSQTKRRLKIRILWNPGWLEKSYRGRKSNLMMDGLLMISDDDRKDRWTAEMTYPQ